MLTADLQEHSKSYGREVAAARRRLETQAIQQGRLDFERYALLSSLETLLTATEATCAAMDHAEAAQRKAGYRAN